MINYIHQLSIVKGFSASDIQYLNSRECVPSLWFCTVSSEHFWLCTAHVKLHQNGVLNSALAETLCQLHNVYHMYNVDLRLGGTFHFPYRSWGEIKTVTVDDSMNRVYHFSKRTIEISSNDEKDFKWFMLHILVQFGDNMMLCCFAGETMYS